MVIAMDGTSSSGKSSMAHLIAEKLHILHVNTGQIYRAIGLYACENGLFNKLNNDGSIHVTDEEINNVVNNTTIELKFIDGKQHTFLNGADVSNKLYLPEISDYSSRVSSHKKVREHVLKIQRDMAKNNDIIMEGRDITSHVFPDAEYKFYITADVEERAKRRMLELQKDGVDCNFDEIKQDLIARDKRDMTRDVSPLIIVPDAIVIDTTNNTLEEMVDKIISYIKE